MNKLLVGIDIGTTLTKGVLIDADGRTLAKSSREATLYSERPTWAEEEPEEWWRNTKHVIAELFTRSGANPSDILAVGISGMVPALVMLDSDGAPIRRSIQQNDARTVHEIRHLKNNYDEGRFFELTGGSINQQVIAPKIHWLKAHEPKVISRLATVMGSYDYIAYKLTDELSIEHNWALESGLYDITQGAWSDELILLAGLTPEQLPPIRSSHEIIGAVSESAALAGVADHVASAFTAMAVHDGDLLIKFGGAGDVLYSLDRLVTDPRLFIDYHVVPGAYYLNGCMATSGSLIKWYAQQFCQNEVAEANQKGINPYAYLDSKILALPPGSEGLILLPYFLGEKTPLHDPDARGTIIGLGLHHNRFHIYKAALEAVVYGFRHHIDVLQERDLPVQRILASDGGASSNTWLQIAANILGRPISRVLGHTGSSLGAAFTAGKAVGAFAGWDEITRYVSLDEPFEPQTHPMGIYNELYPLYQESYRRLKSLYPQLGVVAARASGEYYE
jgi:xylulokinase